MQENFEWTFPSATKCEIKGLNDSGVETFRGNMIASLAREICQNSLDAAISADKPVEVEFATFEIPRAEFPAVDEFADAMQRSADFTRDNGQARAFFAALGPVLAAPTLKCLRISDFKTKGLCGVRTKDPSVSTDWRSLVMSSGVSDKSDDKGGSFGIGKYAAFSCSQFRTAFYATKTFEGDEGFQGVTRLVTFLNQYGELTLGTGYLGAPEAAPARHWYSLDSSFERSAPGTDIFIPAFLGTAGFRNEIIHSVLDGFLYAIWKERIVVRIDDGDSLVRIDRKWLERAYRSGDELFKDFRPTYEALRQPTSDWRTLAFGDLGRVRLVLRHGKDLDRRIAIVRQPGMLIQRKGHFRSHISFTGLLVVEGNGLNGILKKFENPQHTQWEVMRCPGDADAHYVQEIYRFCRDQIGQFVRNDLGDEIDSGLGDVLPDSGDEGESKNEEILDPRARRILPKEEVRPRKRRRRKGAKGGTPTDREHGSDRHDTKHPKPTSGDAGQGGAKNVIRRAVGRVSFRQICRDRKAGAYRLKIVPAADSANAAVDVIAVAEIRDYPAPVKSAARADGTPLVVSGSEIRGLSFAKGVPLEIDLTLDYSDYLSLEVECYEYN